MHNKHHHADPKIPKNPPLPPRCSYDCCNNYNNLAYPCDLAFINFNPNLRDPSIAVCSHYSCYDQFGNFNCQFKNEPYREDFSGEPIFNYASWVYAFSDDLLPLLDSDGAKVKEALKLQGNITSGDGKGLGVYQIEEEITDLNGGNGISGINGIINGSKNPRSLLAQIEGEKEMVAMEKGALAQSKIDKEKANTKLMKILTPLLIVAMVLSLAVATVTMKYKRLKKTIKYDGVKDADYYTKLDPADMAAEQEAQALINGAYDI